MSDRKEFAVLGGTAALDGERRRMDSEAYGHALILRFDTNEREFARGFEAGRLWALARGSGDEIVETIHASNLEMVLRIAEATGRRVVTVDIDETWVSATLLPPTVLD